MALEIVHAASSPMPTRNISPLKGGNSDGFETYPQPFHPIFRNMRIEAENRLEGKANKKKTRGTKKRRARKREIQETWKKRRGETRDD